MAPIEAWVTGAAEEVYRVWGRQWHHEVNEQRGPQLIEVMRERYAGDVSIHQLQ